MPATPPDPTSGFTLDERLRTGSFHVVSWPLCEVLLKDDRRHPWVVLVPRRAGVREIHELDPADRAELLRESCTLGRALLARPGAEKLNVAALGNVVPQLHVHHVVRSRTDPTWPAPLWGAGPPEPYAPAERDALLAYLRALPLEGDEGS